MARLKKFFGFLLCYIVFLIIDQFLEARGFVPGRWLSEAYDRVNIQIPETIFSQAFIILASLLLYYSEVRLKWIEKIFDRSTKTIEHIELLPGKSGRGSEGWHKFLSAYRGNEYNVFLLDAAYFIATKQWSHPGLDLDEEYDGMVQLKNRVIKASKEFVQFASEGKITIWGRPNHKAPLQKIASEYWLNHELEYWSVWQGIKEEVKTEAINNGSQIIYTELKMSKAEVEKLWPVEST